MGILRRRGAEGERRKRTLAPWRRELRGGCSSPACMRRERCKTRRRLVCRNFRAFPPPIVAGVISARKDLVNERPGATADTIDFGFATRNERENGAGRQARFEDRYLTSATPLRENGSLCYCATRTEILLKGEKKKIK